MIADCFTVVSFTLIYFLQVIKNSSKSKKGQDFEPEDYDEVDARGNIELYGKWQLEPLRLPSAVNGIVPRVSCYYSMNYNVIYFVVNKICEMGHKLHGICMCMVKFSPPKVEKAGIKSEKHGGQDTKIFNIFIFFKKEKNRVGKPKSIVFSPLPPPELGQLAKESRLKATQSKPLRAAKIFNIIQVQLEKSSSTP